jgi:hypothetical protein
MAWAPLIVGEMLRIVGFQPVKLCQPENELFYIQLEPLVLPS